MACKFHTLHSDDNGYVVRCKDCGFYQVGFISSMFTLSADNYEVFMKVVEYKIKEDQRYYAGYEKSILMETPAAGFCMILSRIEATRLYNMLENADSEAKAQEMFRLFHK